MKGNPYPPKRQRELAISEQLVKDELLDRERAASAAKKTAWEKEHQRVPFYGFECHPAFKPTRCCPSTT